MSAATRVSSLVFAWHSRDKVARMLAGFLLLSLIVHGLAFFVFQIVYPSPVAIAPPPPDVSLLDLSKPEHEGLRRWVDAQDPALLSQAPDPVPRAFLDFPYRPSFAGVHSAPKPFIPESAPVVPPPALDPNQVLSSIFDSRRAPDAVPRLAASRFQVFGPLAGRLAQNPEALIPLHAATQILEPARFLIGVTDTGEVLYHFLQNSSGESAIDDSAEARLKKARFAPGREPLSWGVASFFWGSDAYAPGGKAP